ncbi:VOC family protein [uncultured Maribacter sp.]|uniref:VOC family protein n=1 Tax=uncultured Maribacter sp. TaxID=431308 RepID=UPI00262D2960|nr:VOC family protein [uncultured Maribacter sp.]
MKSNILKKEKITSIHANLATINVDKTLDYYKNIGFKVLQKFPETGESEWGWVEKDDIRLMFQNKTSLFKEFPELNFQTQGGALTLWFQVENIAEWYENIKDKTKVIRPLGVTPYNGANEFVIIDINGFILHFSDFQLKN